MKHVYLGIALLLHSAIVLAQTTSNFEALSLKPESYWEGADLSGGFTNANAYFKNSYNFYNKVGYWTGGFAYTNISDTANADTHLYCSYPGAGVGNSTTYAIGAFNAVVKLLNEASTTPVTGCYVANTMYTVISMKKGDMFAKKFGGIKGNDPDWFQLSIRGYKGGVITTDTIKVMLADYRFEDNSKDYILDTWRWVDLRRLGIVDSLQFTFSSSDNSFGYMNTPAYVAIDHFNEPLYDAAVKNGGTKAIFKDSPLFKSWASNCSITRGYQTITNPAAGFATSGTDVNGTLKAGTNATVSLGDSGVAIIQFDVPVKNGEGPDFAVFENGFDMGIHQFLELAFVEVSSDGIHYVRFPAVSKTDAFTQTKSFAATDASLLYNLAGKYVADYGTPFDLEELKNISGININRITHIKLIDVIGTIDLKASSKDSLGNPVNDPFTTPFISSGFDLDAVGVIHQDDLSTGFMSKNASTILQVYPNPSSSIFNFAINHPAYIGEMMEIVDASGIVMYRQLASEASYVDVSSWNNGIYYVRVGDVSQKIIKVQ